MKYIYIRKISMNFTIKLFISWCPIFNFDISTTYFLNPHFSFSMCDKHSVTFQKSTMNPFFF